MSRRRGARGSVSVELVLVAPVLLALLSLVTAFGRYGSTESVVEQAARDSARAATQVQTQDQADEIIETTVRDTLEREAPPSCAESAATDVDMSYGEFANSSAYEDEPMNMLTVTVSCTVDTGDLAFLPLGDFDIERSFTSPFDVFKAYYQ